MKCYHPITKQNGEQVPCGRCVNCRTNRLLAMSFRLQQEEKHSIASSFITLTYDTDHLPKIGRTPTLQKRDLQLFFKRLRKLNTYDNNGQIRLPGLKYIACGEYGDSYQRPHYHIILFNCPELNNIDKAWQLDGEKIGQIYYGDVNANTIGYTFKYMTKDMRLDMLDERQQPFRLFSKRLGISYLTDEMRSWHLQDLHNRNFVWNDGHKLAMPRYYKGHIYDGYKRDLLQMSGSLMRQDQDYKQILTGTKMSWQELRQKQAFSTNYYNHKQLITHSKF